MERTEQWRDDGHPEASLIGVQYRGSDRGGHQGRWVVSDASGAPWPVVGMLMRNLWARVRDG
jgi:hypothetical protein